MLEMGKELSMGIIFTSQNEYKYNLEMEGKQNRIEEISLKEGVSFKPFQTYLWGRRTRGKPNCQGVYERVCSGGYPHRHRPFQDRKYSHRPNIYIFPSPPRIENIEIRNKF